MRGFVFIMFLVEFIAGGNSKTQQNHGRVVQTQGVRKKQKHKSKVTFGKDVESFYGPFAVFLGPGVVLDRVFLKSKFYAKKVTRRKLSELGFGVVGPLNYPKRGP